VRRVLAPRSWSLGLLALAAAAAALLGVRLFAAAASAPASGTLEIRDGHATARGAFVAGDELLGPRSERPELRRGAQRLAEAASAPLLGGDGAVASPSPDGALVAYATWEWTRPIDWTKAFAEQGIATGDALGVPTLRIHDVVANRDRRLEPGSFGAAWQSDGAIAYVVGEPAAYRANEEYLTRVVVRSTPEAAAQEWTDVPARYRVFGWAGGRLVVVRGAAGGPPDVEVLDAPRRERLLAARAAALAISPDGRTVLVSVGEPGGSNGAVSLRDAVDGRELATLPVQSVDDPVTGRSLEWVSGPASWVGDHVLLGSDAGLVVLRVAGGDLAVEQVLHVDLGRFTTGSIYEPRFVDDDARELVWWADVPRTRGPAQSVQFACDRYALTCTRKPPVPAARAPRPVYDESRGSR
jgi:hypothetical protein